MAFRVDMELWRILHCTWKKILFDFSRVTGGKKPLVCWRSLLVFKISYCFKQLVWEGQRQRANIMSNFSYQNCFLFCIAMTLFQSLKEQLTIKHFWASLSFRFHSINYFMNLEVGKSAGILYLSRMCTRATEVGRKLKRH